MNKSTRIAAAALCLVGVGLVSPAGAGESDAKGPACSDYTGGNAYYEGTSQPGQPIVHAKLSTAAPTCTSVTYTFYVLNAAGSQLLASSSQTGNGTSGSVSWSVPVPVDPLDPATSVCVYATSGNANHEMDRAPDSGCFVLKIGERPGQAWN